MIRRQGVSVAIVVVSVLSIVVLVYAARRRGGEDVPTNPGSAARGAPEARAKTQDGEPSSTPPAGSSESSPAVSPVVPPANASPVIPPTTWPSGLIDLTNWYLTLPVDTALADNPDVVMQPQLAAFALSPHFHVTDAKDGVVFRAHAGGVTTDNSSYPRSELREMTNSGKTKAGWSNTQGTHTLTIRQAITHVPAVKPEVVAGQIHDKSDDVIMIRLEGSRLFVESDGENIGDLNTQYQLGTVFTVRIEASGGRIRVLYDGVLKVDYAKSGSGLYFKAGCYTQSNTSKGDDPQAYGEVVIYSLQVSHT